MFFAILIFFVFKKKYHPLKKQGIMALENSFFKI